MPFDNYLDGQVPDFLWFERLLEDQGSGLNKPAAVIVETIQGEGGINVARAEWLRGLAELCKRRDMLLIVDDIQMGCGRTGGFFSFEDAGITPDIVTLSKSISGYGLPMSLTLFKPELDIWEPGEHNGTFRGHNPAFVTATAALDTYWADGQMEKQTLARGQQIEQALVAICAEHSDADATYRGRGMVWGLEFPDPARAARVCGRAFELGLILETSGPQSEVVKLLAGADHDAGRPRRGAAHAGPGGPRDRLTAGARPRPSRTGGCVHAGRQAAEPPTDPEREAQRHRDRPILQGA